MDGYTTNLSILNLTLKLIMAIRNFFFHGGAIKFGASDVILIDQKAQVDLLA